MKFRTGYLSPCGGRAPYWATLAAVSVKRNIQDYKVIQRIRKVKSSETAGT